MLELGRQIDNEIQMSTTAKSGRGASGPLAPGVSGARRTGGLGRPGAASSGAGGKGLRGATGAAGAAIAAGSGAGGGGGSHHPGLLSDSGEVRVRSRSGKVGLLSIETYLGTLRVRVL